MLKHTSLVFFLSACHVATAQQVQSRTLFDFANPQSAAKWQTVNDTVMGGRSDGRFMLSANRLVFFGNLSLQNNGGFASVRSRSQSLGLQPGNTIVARVKGDGRRYTLNLYVPGRRTAFSYRVAFDTPQGQWIDLRVPLDRFVATSFGQTVLNAGPVNPQQVNSIGFLLGDKRAGPFRLEVESVKVQ